VNTREDSKLPATGPRLCFRHTRCADNGWGGLVRPFALDERTRLSELLTRTGTLFTVLRNNTQVGTCCEWVRETSWDLRLGTCEFVGLEAQRQYSFRSLVALAADFNVWATKHFKFQTNEHRRLDVTLYLFSFPDFTGRSPVYSRGRED